MMETAYLVLGNGKVFKGKHIGAKGKCLGELVFTTNMEGYLETLTDPSYAGQIVIQTFPLIGNYGVIDEDFEGKSALKGYVVRELCDTPSNFRSQEKLDEYLKQQGIPGICGVDTRELTRMIREEGVMNALICSRIPKDLSAIKDFAVTKVVDSVSCRKETLYPPQGEKKHTVVLVDYGAKRNIIRSLTKRGCQVITVPSTTTAAKILSHRPDGIMLSNGPGDPAENTFAIAQIKKLMGKVPLFGICLGHQLTALAMGGKTEKLKYGHRGGNQPVKEAGGRTYITSQNHGYAVIAKSLEGTGVE
ncbi:MAG: glutamine-hydrolyzing carbamoyl-phosphate synthase small subunit, partial [Spirochaetia bacterium]|nr:glutamine-hydrolyzing carbamoyl-phosphate synthase small subunit [Spirochaetia bacterium]